MNFKKIILSVAVLHILFSVSAVFATQSGPIFA